MKTGVNLRELVAQHKKLLHATRLPDALMEQNAPDFLRAIDQDFARQLLSADQPWGKEDAFAEGGRIISDVLMASDEGKQLYLASEIDLLSRVKDTGADLVHRGPFEILEGIFPLRVRHQVIHVVRTGKFRDKPFTAEDIKELAFLSGVPTRKVEQTAQSLPLFSTEVQQAVLTAHRHFRDAAALALEEHLQAAEAARRAGDAEQLASLGTLAEGMAHHFSNLLAIILGYASLVLDRSKLTEEAAEALRKVSEAAQRGRRFTEEILSHAALKSEEETTSSVHERIRGVLELLQSRLSNTIRAETKLQASRDLVQGPPGIVQQAVFNLLTNAIDSMPGGGLMTITTVNTGGEDGVPGTEYIKIAVTDSGTGSEEKKAGKTRAGRAPPPAAAGASKLTTLFGHISRLDGMVTVHAEPSGATRVEILLRTAEPTARREKKIRRRLAPSHIWVADDDAVVREMCKRVLCEEGHSVDELPTGKDTEQKLRGADKAPDLIIYDFTMFDRTGREFVDRLREDGNRVPVILISGLSPELPEVQRALKHRKTFFLQKPFSYRDMSDMVSIAMGETLIDE